MFLRGINEIGRSCGNINRAKNAKITAAAFIPYDVVASSCTRTGHYLFSTVLAASADSFSTFNAIDNGKVVVESKRTARNINESNDAKKMRGIYRSTRLDTIDKSQDPSRKVIISQTQDKKRPNYKSMQHQHHQNHQHHHHHHPLSASGSSASATTATAAAILANTKKYMLEGNELTSKELESEEKLLELELTAGSEKVSKVTMCYSHLALKTCVHGEKCAHKHLYGIAAVQRRFALLSQLCIFGMQCTSRSCRKLRLHGFEKELTDKSYLKTKEYLMKISSIVKEEILALSQNDKVPSNVKEWESYVCIHLGSLRWTNIMGKRMVEENEQETTEDAGNSNGDSTNRSSLEFLEFFATDLGHGSFILNNYEWFPKREAEIVDRITDPWQRMLALNGIDQATWESKLNEVSQKPYFLLVDLHYIAVDEVFDVVTRVLKEANERVVTRIDIIFLTGSGRRSKYGFPRLFEALLGYFTLHKTDMLIGKDANGFLCAFWVTVTSKDGKPSQDPPKLDSLGK